jgi:hypothetical protein
LSIKSQNLYDISQALETDWSWKPRRESFRVRRAILGQWAPAMAMILRRGPFSAMLDEKFEDSSIPII